VAVAQTVPANAVKAAYLTKFAPFVDWPKTSEPADAPFVICVAGGDPFGDVLDRVAARQKIGSHPIVIRHLKAFEPGCKVLYASPSAEKSVAQIFDPAANAPVLTVSDSDSDGGTHGIICFVRDKSHVRFDIDAGAARQHGLVMSSKLLDLARKVVNAPEAAP
jgi:hypothetical protein